MHAEIIVGDAMDVLKTMPDQSVHCCVTSPPYWGLRDYGVEGQLGLEKSPDEYVAKMVEVFREVKRVLRDDGTLWLNLGDSFCGGGRGGNPEDSSFRKQATNAGSLIAPSPVPVGLKPKDMVGIPWRVAFALQSDGWYLRSDIIWAKPNPMPESVTDRPTKAHEYLFLLSKSERYFYDAEAIKEQSTDPESLRPEGRNKRSGDAFTQAHAEDFARTRVGFSKLEGACYPLRNKRTVWTVPTAPYPEAHFATYPPDLIKPCILAGCPVGGTVLDPFGGSGTTGMVALELGRKAILIELNPKYAELANERCHVTPGLPLSV